VKHPYDIQGVNIPHVGYGRMIHEIQKVAVDRLEQTEDARTVLFGMTPDMIKGSWEGQSTAVLTMWETDLLPARFGRLLPPYDRVIVPCDWNKELFDDVHHDVHVVPLGVDHDTWKPQVVEDNPKFRFMTGGSGWLRKGIPQVVQAFRDADLPDSELVIKLPTYVFDDPEKFDLGPNITVVRDNLSVTDERDLHATADCFVSASRGEGFGLIPLQQLALGNRVIAPASTGHLMFSHLFDYALSVSPEKAYMKNYDGIGNWFVPNHDELVDSMKDAYAKGRPTFIQRQARHKKTLGFSWEHTLDKLLAAHPPSGMLSVKRWKPAGEHLICVKALKKVEADVGAYKIRIPNGEVKWIPVSTFDSLVESGNVTEFRAQDKVY
jgi:hypothetical protein